LAFSGNEKSEKRLAYISVNTVVTNISEEVAASIFSIQCVDYLKRWRQQVDLIHQ
jgi:hypothetical protein